MGKKLFNINRTVHPTGIYLYPRIFLNSYLKCWIKSASYPLYRGLRYDVKGTHTHTHTHTQHYIRTTLTFNGLNFCQLQPDIAYKKSEKSVYSFTVVKCYQC